MRSHLLAQAVVTARLAWEQRMGVAAVGQQRQYSLPCQQREEAVARWGV